MLLPSRNLIKKNYFLRSTTGANAHAVIANATTMSTTEVRLKMNYDFVKSTDFPDNVSVEDLNRRTVTSELKFVLNLQPRV